MNRATIINLISTIVARRGQAAPTIQEQMDLAELGFRSLDLAELCLRIEETLGKQFDFGAGFIRRLRTVSDVCDLLEGVVASKA